MTATEEEQQRWLGVPVAPLAFSADTTVGTARAAMRGLGAREAIVMEGERPLGVITVPDVRGSADAVVRDVMQWECVRIDSAADGLTTVRAFRDAAWKSLRRRRPGRAWPAPDGHRPSSATGSAARPRSTKCSR